MVDPLRVVEYDLIAPCPRVFGIAIVQHPNGTTASDVADTVRLDKLRTSIMTPPARNK
jgi:hypothetical protein